MTTFNDKILLLIILATALNACAAHSDSSKVNSKANDKKTMPITRCTEPRPEICTQIYAPVCASLNNGEIKTYASDCVACSDKNVTGYTPGECQNKNDQKR